MSECESCDKIDQKDIQAVKSVVMLRGDETPKQLNEKINWKAIENYELFNENGVKVPFKYVYDDCTTIIIFIRHLLCFVSKEYVEDLSKLSRAALNERKVRLAIIGCSDPKYMKQYRKDTGYWAEFYTDPSRDLYSSLGCKYNDMLGSHGDLGNLSHSKHVKSGTIAGIMKSALRSSTFPGEWQGDPKQQGGSFIMGPGDQCSFAHIDANAADHYPINKLLDVVGLENVCFQKDSGIITV